MQGHLKILDYALSAVLLGALVIALAVFWFSLMRAADLKQAALITQTELVELLDELERCEAGE